MRKKYWLSIFLLLIFVNAKEKSILNQLPTYYYSFEKHNPNFVSHINGLNEESSINFDFDSLTVPIKRIGNLLLFETVIDGQYGNLIFDTGSASEIVLNKTYFRDYKSVGSKVTSGVNGVPQKVSVIKLDSLIFSDIIFNKKYVEVTDLSRIENRLNTKVFGFFGLQLFNDFEIVIDLNKSILQLFPAQKKRRRTISRDTKKRYDYIQDIEIMNNVVFIWVNIGGKELRFCFDTAAEKNLISYSAPEKVLNTIKITGRANLIGAGKKKKEVLIGQMSDLKLGERSLNNMETIIADLSALNTVYETNITGVLGYDFLLLGKISLNLKSKQFKIDYY